MTKNKFFLALLLLLGLGGLCLRLNRDWFAPKRIQISHRVSPWLREPHNRATPVVFSFDQHYKFKEVKVVVASEIATNKYAHALWHLISPSNSVLTTSFTYGEPFQGMSSQIKDAIADPLQPGVLYRLLVKTADVEASHDFDITIRR